jgi:ATP synthase subunit 6
MSSFQSTIFTFNILGMIPGIETITSDAAFTFILSIGTMLVVIILGFSLHNIRFFSILYPAGTPMIMAPFIIFIEFVSYIARAISLGMRLFANMFAGHSLVKILMSFA